MSSSAREGASAPDFTLAGPEGPFTLSEQRGTPVLLLFYPGDETPVCTKQFCSYRDRADELAELDVVAVGISGGDVAAKEKFSSKHGLTVPLLADEDSTVAKLYDVHGRFGTKRATILIDAEGVIRSRVVHKIGLGYENVDDLRKLLESIGAAAPAA